jgi:hypothetical protein
VSPAAFYRRSKAVAMANISASRQRTKAPAVASVAASRPGAAAASAAASSQLAEASAAASRLQQAQLTTPAAANVRRERRAAAIPARRRQGRGAPLQASASVAPSSELLRRVLPLEVGLLHGAHSELAGAFYRRAARRWRPKISRPPLKAVAPVSYGRGCAVDGKHGKEIRSPGTRRMRRSVRGKYLRPWLSRARDCSADAETTWCRGAEGLLPKLGRGR